MILKGGCSHDKQAKSIVRDVSILEPIVKNKKSDILDRLLLRREANRRLKFVTSMKREVARNKNLFSRAQPTAHVSGRLLR